MEWLLVLVCTLFSKGGGGGKFGGSRGFHGFQGGKRRESVEYRGDTIEN